MDRQSTNNFLLVALKGFGMGAANVVPGVSGGTIALLTGIFKDIIDSINAFTQKDTWKALFSGKLKDFWKKINETFLLALMIGILLSVFTLAKVVTYTLAYHPVATWAFFFGLILASSVLMFKDVKGWKANDVIMVVIGLALGVAVCTLSPTQTTDDLWFIFVCGAIAICTMILPGISGSFILLILGKYEYIMQALTDINMPVLVVFAIGCVCGILAFAKFLRWLLSKWERQTLLVLLGFVVGSLIKVWPWYDKTALAKAQILRGDAIGEPLKLQIPEAVIFCLIGIALVVALEFLGRKKKAE